MRALRYAAPFLLCATAALAQTPPAPTYQAEINTLADHLAPAVTHSPHEKGASPKILIANFTNRANHPNLLGEQLADALANALQTRLGANAVVSRKQFQDRMQSAGLTLEDLASPNVLAWNAAQSGATVVLTGAMTRAEATPTLEVKLFSAPEAKALYTASTALTTSPDDAKLADSPANWQITNSAWQCPTLAGQDHVSSPRCLRCGTVNYTNTARKAKWQGNVMLKVSVDETGHPDAAIVLIGAPYGLSEQSIKSVLQWQLSPALKDGQPTRTCVQIETNYHLY